MRALGRSIVIVGVARIGVMSIGLTSISGVASIAGIGFIASVGSIVSVVSMAQAQCAWPAHSSTADRSGNSLFMGNAGAPS